MLWRLLKNSYCLEVSDSTSKIIQNFIKENTDHHCLRRPWYGHKNILRQKKIYWKIPTNLNFAFSNHHLSVDTNKQTNMNFQNQLVEKHWIKWLLSYKLINNKYVVEKRDGEGYLFHQFIPYHDANHQSILDIDKTYVEYIICLENLSFYCRYYIFDSI